MKLNLKKPTGNKCQAGGGLQRQTLEGLEMREKAISQTKGKKNTPLGFDLLHERGFDRFEKEGRINDLSK